ncbi:chitin disaccharide deacetylase [Vibrio nereis]|uniref:Carbohydrate deacetylase n=1 Tax=Vibrio nereis TaxID=693 RepID=A0A0M0HJE1_VIBNE|nr:chitin disaccharide deacetylase [Vibrio nereis]KOO02141.1 hypothetical protein AKJ17_16745 [Vibrio nereis]
MKVIFNADDFGLTEGVNNGIVKAHLEGVVNSTTMLVGMAAEKHAVSLANDLPTLKVGLHLRFTLGQPLTAHRCFVDESGDFLKYQDFWETKAFDSTAIYEECIAQVEHFLRLGLNLSHLDSHHHAHVHPSLLPIVREVAEKYSVPLRGEEVANRSLGQPRYKFTHEFYDQGVDFKKLSQHLLELKQEYDVVEVMCHPAEVDQALLDGSRYAIQREKELAILTDDRLAVLLERHGIEVTDYSALHTNRTFAGV